MFLPALDEIGTSDWLKERIERSLWHSYKLQAWKLSSFKDET